jgi:hypothetical protein
MKKRPNCLLFIVLVGVLAGCSLAGREINLKSQGEKTGVFYEIEGEEGFPPKGLVDLQIKASVKTHMEGYYFIEPHDTFHGQAGYPFLINIDGQAVIWKLKGQKEITPKRKGSDDPEAGAGMRYQLNKKIRITSGPHKIFFSLPGENVYKEITLILKEGQADILEFKPRYRRPKGQSRNFLYGVDGGEFLLNGNSIG